MFLCFQFPLRSRSLAAVAIRDPRVNLGLKARPDLKGLKASKASPASKDRRERKGPKARKEPLARLGRRVTKATRATKARQGRSMCGRLKALGSWRATLRKFSFQSFALVAERPTVRSVQAVPPLDFV